MAKRHHTSSTVYSTLDTARSESVSHEESVTVILERGESRLRTVGSTSDATSAKSDHSVEANFLDGKWTKKAGPWRPA